MVEKEEQEENYQRAGLMKETTIEENV